jgi:class 3 adenylate cyclase/TolB-like protein
MASTTPEDPWPLPELTRARRAIVVVDVVESVRLMQEDEAGFIDRWRRFVHAVRTEVLPKHGGRLVKSLGDGMLLEFESVPQAVNAALFMQRLSHDDRVATSKGIGLELRMGIHEAEVMADELDLYGSGVNLAARLAALGRPGDVVISMDARARLLQDFDADFEDMGECWLKHIDEPIRACRAAPAMTQALGAGPLRLQQEHASIAVLPLRLQSAAPGPLLGELVAEDIASWLTRVPHMAVISSLSSMAVRDRSATYPQLAQLLGVKYLVHGSCARDGDRLRVHVQLLEGSSGRELWAGTEHGALADLWASDGTLPRTLAGHLSKAVVGAEVARASTMSLPNLESYSILFGAIALLHRLSLRDFNRAREMLEFLSERHPRSAVPRAWLGKWYVMRVGQGWSSDPKSDGSRALAQTAAALDAEPGHAFSLTIDGFATGYMKKDFAVAEQRYEDALKINPNESLAWLFRSAMLGYRDQGDAAIDSALQAQSLSPIDPMQYYFDHFTSLAMLLAGRYDEAIRYGLRSLKGNRTHASSLRALAMAQALAGKIEGARATGVELMRVEPLLTQGAFRTRYPGQNRDQVERLVGALALAGVPA